MHPTSASSRWRRSAATPRRRRPCGRRTTSCAETRMPRSPRSMPAMPSSSSSSSRQCSGGPAGASRLCASQRFIPLSSPLQRSTRATTTWSTSSSGTPMRPPSSSACGTSGGAYACLLRITGRSLSRHLATALPVRRLPLGAREPQQGPGALPRGSHSRRLVPRRGRGPVRSVHRG
jgi:hypothetical protein